MYHAFPDQNIQQILLFNVNLKQYIIFESVIKYLQFHSQ